MTATCGRSFRKNVRSQPPIATRVQRSASGRTAQLADASHAMLAKRPLDAEGGIYPRRQPGTGVMLTVT
jgi:hypothetical protein